MRARCKRAAHRLASHWHVPAATLLMTTQPLLTEACLEPDGSYAYALPSVVFLAEARSNTRRSQAARTLDRQRRRRELRTAGRSSGKALICAEEL